MGRRAASALASFMRQPITSGFPGDSVVKNLPVNAGDTGSIPGLGRSSREGNGNPLQCSHGGNPMDRGTWWATVHEVAEESDMTHLMAIAEFSKFAGILSEALS